MYRLNLPVIFCLLLIHFQSGCYQKATDDSDRDKASQESNNESNGIDDDDGANHQDAFDSETHFPKNETDPFFEFITDFETAEEKLRNTFVKTFEGAIHEGGGKQECPWNGSRFTLTLEAPDAMFCRQPESDQITPCDGETDATLLLEGWFEVSGREPIKVNGVAGIDNRQEPTVGFSFVLDYDSPCFRESIEARPSPEIWRDTIVYFEWQCRVSDDDADDPVWQVCNCVID